MILYLNNEYCTSFDQLRSYFITLPEFGSDLYWDLIESGRDQTISQWLHDNVGNAEMAHQLESIDDQLGDTDYIEEMRRIILGEDYMYEVPSKIDKPKFTSCFNLEKTQLEQTESGYSVSVNLKVLMLVNENFELRIETDWGIRGEYINPLNFEISEEKVYRFHFRKRPNKELGEILIYGNEELLGKDSVVRNSIIKIDVNGVKFSMIKIDGCTFRMGTTQEIFDTGIDEKPVHKVTLSSYYIGETVVTQALWKALMNTNPSYFVGDKLPVDSVSWYDCQEFIDKLNSLTRKKFRLPTEAEWEFAARGGYKSKGYLYSGSNIINDVAWYRNNSGRRTHEVCTKRSNELGLYDMSGNVFEWCQDWFGDYSSKEQTNPVGPHYGTYRVCRGHCWDSEAFECRPFSRCGFEPDTDGRVIGFRLVLSE